MKRLCVPLLAAVFLAASSPILAQDRKDPAKAEEKADAKKADAKKADAKKADAKKADEKKDDTKSAEKPAKKKKEGC